MNAREAERKCELIEYMKCIIKLTDEMYNFICIGKEKRIFDLLKELIDGLDLIIFNINKSDDKIKTKNIDKILLEMEEGISNKDYILMGDILIYELKPMLESWVERLTN